MHTLGFLALSLGVGAFSPTSPLPWQECMARHGWPTQQADIRIAYDWRSESFPVVPRQSVPQPADVIATAREFVGTPYVWGGLGVPGFDCSGFINKVYALNGYDLPRVSREQVFIGVAVPRQALSTGDLLFFTEQPGETRISHVAMYINDNEFIHAAIGKGEVAYDRLTARYYDTRFFAARRVLALPPGRYSTLAGSAAADAQFATEEAASSYLARKARAPLPKHTASREVAAYLPPAAAASVDAPLVQAPPGAEIVIPPTLLQENTEQDRPPQLAATFIKGAVTQVGPTLTGPDATGFGLRTGVGGMGDVAFLAAVPEITYFGDSDAFRAAVAVPLQLPLGTANSAAYGFQGSWQSFRDYTKVLKSVTFGQKESSLYVDLGRTTSASLGHGQIMRYYTPNMDSRVLPNYVLRPNALSFSFDASITEGGFELFIDDITKPSVVGALAFAKPGVLFELSDPLLHSISVALTYATDLNAPYAPRPTGGYDERSVHALGLDAEIKLYKTDQHDLKTYVDVSTLMHPNGTGIGAALGALWRSNLGARRNHIVRARLEGRLSSATFVPSYFDTTYALDRLRAPTDTGTATSLTKLALLDALKTEPNHWSMYAELTYQLHRRIVLGASYEDGAVFGSLASNHPLRRNLMMFMSLKNLYVGQSSRALNFYLAYQLRNFESVTPLFDMTRANEYAFATVSIDVSRGIEVGGTLRKALNPTSQSRAAVDGMLDVLMHYDL